MGLKVSDLDIPLLLKIWHKTYEINLGIPLVQGKCTLSISNKLAIFYFYVQAKDMYHLFLTTHKLMTNCHTQQTKKSKWSRKVHMVGGKWGIMCFLKFCKFYQKFSNFYRGFVLWPTWAQDLNWTHVSLAYVLAYFTSFVQGACSCMWTVV